MVKLKTTRNASGSYSYKHTNGVTYLIDRMYDWDTCQPTGFWTYRAEIELNGLPGVANDIFCSKRDALDGLAELLDIN